MTSDFSEHLILARKALSTAEAQAAMHNWKEARESLAQVQSCAVRARWAIESIERIYAGRERAKQERQS